MKSARVATKAAPASGETDENQKTQNEPNPKNQDQKQADNNGDSKQNNVNGTNQHFYETNPAAKPLNPQASFEALLNDSLSKHDAEEMPPIPHRAPKQTATNGPAPRSLQSLTTDAVSAVTVKSSTHDVLPLVLNFSFTANTKAIGDRAAAQAESYALHANDTPQKPLAAGSAFTAKVQVSDQPSFAIPSAEAGNAALAAKVADEKKEAPVASLAKAASAAQSNISENVTPEQTNTVQAAVSSPSHLQQTGNLAAKESAPVHAAAPIGEVSAVHATPAGTPVKEISLQLPGARGIEVKLTESAGQVKVDVRTADPALTQDLRGSLHELASALEKKGLSSEITHPVDGTTLRTGEMNSSKSSTSDNQESSGRQQQERGQQERQREQEQFWDGRPQKERTAAWNDAIDSHLATSQSGQL